MEEVEEVGEVGEVGEVEEVEEVGEYFFPMTTDNRQREDIAPELFGYTTFYLHTNDDNLVDIVCKCLNITTISC
ncbi:MAG: hypothetical protein HEQ25_07550 [Dolichospermum sp. DET73]|nr:hypothetical protein [Dolichospermum sp. DET73]